MAAVGRDQIVVTGLGMVSSLGRDVVTSCAAARAGITRIGELDGLQLVDPDTGEADSARGHVILGFTDGFAGLGRLVRLGHAALRDLVARTGLDEWGHTGIFLNLPSGFLLREWDRAERSAMGAEDEVPSPVPYELEDRDDVYRKWVLSTIVTLAGAAIDPARQYVHLGDQAGFVQLLQLAIQGLRTGRYEQCIIGGVDSFVEPELLEAAYTFRLLKTSSQEVGFIPGEQAAFVLLEREEYARRRRATIEGIVEAPSHQAEAFHRLSGEPAIGRALAAAIQGTIRELADEGDQTGLTIGSLNGDPYRAYDWGHALVRLRMSYPWMNLPEWYPALFFGEIGAATAPSAMCLAVRGFAREYAGTHQVLLWLASDNGQRSAFCVRRYT